MATATILLPDPDVLAEEISVTLSRIGFAWHDAGSYPLEVRSYIQQIADALSPHVAHALLAAARRDHSDLYGIDRVRLRAGLGALARSEYRSGVEWRTRLLERRTIEASTIEVSDASGGGSLSVTS